MSAGRIFNFQCYVPPGEKCQIGIPNLRNKFGGWSRILIEVELKIRHGGINFSHFPRLFPSAATHGELPAGRKIVLDEKFRARERHNTPSEKFLHATRNLQEPGRGDRVARFPLPRCSHFSYIRISLVPGASQSRSHSAFPSFYPRSDFVSPYPRSIRPWFSTVRKYPRRNVSSAIVIRLFTILFFSLPFSLSLLHIYIDDAFCSIFPEARKILPAMFV